MSAIATPPQNRQIVRQQYVDLLCKYNVQPAKALIIATHCEYSCYNTSIAACNNEGVAPTWQSDTFCHYYHQHTQNIYANMNPESSVQSVYLINVALMDKPSIEFKSICNLPVYQLAPGCSAELREKINTRAKTLAPAKISELFKCPKCYKRETTYELRQSRSADEPQTIYILCKNCSHQWRQ